MEEMLAKLSKKYHAAALNVEFNLPFSSKSYLVTATIKKQNVIARHLNNLKENFYVGKQKEKKLCYSFFWTTVGFLFCFGLFAFHVHI